VSSPAHWLRPRFHPPRASLPSRVPHRQRARSCSPVRVPSVAWIDWLLYASDVVLPDTFEPVFAAGYWAELGRVVRREGLSVERVFAEHLPATAWGDRAR
jgi:hypothetical protein